MPGPKQEGGAPIELQKQDGAARTATMSDKEILELIQSNPDLQRYIDRRVTEGIKTFGANQEKKETSEVEKAMDDGAKPAETTEEPIEKSPESPEPEIDPDAAPLFQKDESKATQESIDKELFALGLSSFAGLISDPGQIESLKGAAIDFLRSQNLGADFSPEKQSEPAANLTPLEAHIAKRLGIDLGDYNKRKKELEQQEGQR